VTFAAQWSANERLRGLLVRLPADDVVAVAAEAGLDFVAVDVARGPADELALARVATVAHLAGLGVVVIAPPDADRRSTLAADVVLSTDDSALRVIDDPQAFADDGMPTALDVRTVVAEASETFARGASAAPVPLVLLPGMLGSPAVFADVVSELGDTISCRPLRIDLDDTVADAADSVLAAAPPRFALAGHSLGAIVALDVVRRAPHRVTRLALLHSSARPPTDAQLAAWAELRRRTETGGFPDVVAEQATINVGEPGKHRPELVTRWVEAARHVGPQGFLRQLAMQASRQDNRTWIARIDIPTVVVSGSLDAVSPSEIQDELALLIPRAEHVTIANAGHMSVLDSPGEVANVLGKWVDTPAVRRMRELVRPA
jgi:pimeloyl-ACP methyl ester carboxylesterase